MPVEFFFFFFFNKLDIKSKVFCSFYLFIFFFCYVNFKLSRFLVNIKNGVFSFVVGRCETP